MVRMLTETASALLCVSRATQEVAHLPPSVAERVHDKCRITLDCALFSVVVKEARVYQYLLLSAQRTHAS